VVAILKVTLGLGNVSRVAHFRIPDSDQVHVVGSGIYQMAREQGMWSRCHLLPSDVQLSELVIHEVSAEKMIEIVSECRRLLNQQIAA